MESNDLRLQPNQLAFIALANEYCQCVENTPQYEKDDFVDQILRLLPRIYMSASDLQGSTLIDEEAYLPSVLEEDYYDTVRRNMEMIFGEHDTYLEVFEDDMKFSDTPIAANVSEGLADIFQVLYNFTANVKDSSIDTIQLSLDAVKEEFESYWSQILCNVLRAVNAIKYNN